MAALLNILRAFPKIVFCGDFNIPRGVNNLYKELKKRYKDAIPHSCVSSLDMNLHAMGKNPVESRKMRKFMVDYIFLSKEYHAKNVCLKDGVSDHKAVVGLVDKKS